MLGKSGKKPVAAAAATGRTSTIRFFLNARTVGMSPRRLNAGFRETFGQSIFQLLIQARMEFARSALVAGGMSVKEVAYATGYSHVSNFSAAFRARFGVPPSQVTVTRWRRSP